MMRAIILTIVVASVTGCLEAPPIEVGDAPYKVYHQDKALLLAESRFEERFNVQVNAYEDARVNWTATLCPYSDSYAVVIDQRCYPGRMYGCDEIYVALSNDDPETTCGTALQHEFAHCLWARAGYGYDGDHHETELWEFVRDMNERVCQEGW